jgi:Ca2+-binding RTX toxin-like protein
MRMPTWFLTEGDDNFPAGGAGPPTNWTNTGADVVNALGGHDTVNGGALNDSLHGNNGNDMLNGEDGDDNIAGDDGNDTINGGDGNDFELKGFAGNDRVNGDDGNDTLNGGAGSDIVRGGVGNDKFDTDSAQAGDNDLLYGDAGNDTLVTQDLAGGAARVRFDGGAGIDTVGAFGPLAGYTFVNCEVLDNLYLIRASVAQINQFASITDHYVNSDLTEIFPTTSGKIDFSTKIAANIKLKVGQAQGRGLRRRQQHHHRRCQCRPDVREFQSQWRRPYVRRPWRQ